jgi:hypothetical protein
VAYNGACSRVLPWWKKKLDESSRIEVLGITRVAWHASYQPQ